MNCLICNACACYIIADKYYRLKYHACATHVDLVVESMFGLKRTIRIMKVGSGNENQSFKT